MQVSELLQNGSMLHMKLSIPDCLHSDKMSPEHMICGVVPFIIKSSLIKPNECADYHHIISIKFKKMFESDHLTYSIKFSSKALNKTETFSIPANICWQKVYECFGSNVADILKKEIDIDLTLDILSSPIGQFASLHIDSHLADFELLGDDGSVKVHKTIMAERSPFIKTLLENSGQRDEATSNTVNVPNASQETLQQLKDYIYLQKMPETGIEQLIALASYFHMPDLEQLCIIKLMSALRPENAAEYLELAMKYEIKMLLMAIIASVKGGVIETSDLERELSK